MKIKLNALGFGNKGQIIVGEAVIAIGLGIAAIGLLYIRNTQQWVCASNKNALDYMEKTYHDLQ